MLSLKEETVQINHHTDISWIQTLCMVRVFQIKIIKSKKIFLSLSEKIRLSVCHRKNIHRKFV